MTGCRVQIANQLLLPRISLSNNQYMAGKNKVETPEQKVYREMVESIAGNISSLAKAVSLLMNGPLKRSALYVLLASSSGLSQERVKAVLTALENLDKDWLNHK